MKKRVRLLIALVRGIARIQGAVMWVTRKFSKPSLPTRAERHLILLREGPMVRFMGAGFFPDKILEHYGVMGMPTPREQSPANIHDNIRDRISELVEDGYTPLQDFPGTELISVEMPQNLNALEDYIADHGLGLVESLEGENLSVRVVDASLAGPLIASHLATQQSAPSQAR